MAASLFVSEDYSSFDLDHYSQDERESNSSALWNNRNYLNRVRGLKEMLNKLLCYGCKQITPQVIVIHWVKNGINNDILPVKNRFDHLAQDRQCGAVDSTSSTRRQKPNTSKAPVYQSHQRNSGELPRSDRRLSVLTFGRFQSNIANLQ